MAQVLTPSGFLAEAARQPFVWGHRDCFLLAADWIVANGLPDPAQGWRGTYRTALGARRLLLKAGGALALARVAMAGFPETSDPRDGDVAIVEGSFETRKGRPWLSHAAAVRCGGRWVVRTQSGLVGNGPPLITPVAAWRVA